MSSRASTRTARTGSTAVRPLTRLAVAVDGEPEADDAFTLGRSLAGAAECDLVVMTVIPDLSLIAPWAASDPMHHDIELQMRRLRDEWHPRARIAIDRDRSVARGLGRMVARAHRELLVVGSSHRAAKGQVRLSGHTRQLIGHLPCPLMIAPRGLAADSRFAVRRVAVGLEDSPAANAALTFAARVAMSTGAELLACGVVDDAPPAFGWPSTATSKMRELWREAIEDRVAGVESAIRERVAAVEPMGTTEVRRGAPGAVLQALSREVDLLVIGSRRWGPVARLVLGGTGETLVHGSHCAIAIVPRPDDPDPGAPGAR